MVWRRGGGSTCPWVGLLTPPPPGRSRRLALVLVCLRTPSPLFFFFSVVVAVFGVLCLCGCEGADDAHRADQVTNLVAASLILMTAGQAVRGAHQLLYDWGKKEGY